MSSDETSVESGMRIYRIKKKSWRAAELGPFLHAIDRVTEHTKNATTSRGTSKCHRLPGESEPSAKAAVATCLPVNCYDPTWLANLCATMKPVYDMLKINPNAYPLVHDQTIQE